MTSDKPCYGNFISCSYKSYNHIQCTQHNIYCLLSSHILTDIQECAINNGGCEHTCTNTAGSFSCSCNSGYVLQPDGKRCLRPSTSKSL